MILILTLLFTSLVSLSIINFLALKYSIYYTYLWFDMPVHILGGMSVAFGYAALPFFNIHLSNKYTTLFHYVLFVLFIGLVWEIFEYIFGISIASPLDDFVTDTFIDFVMDAIGAVLGYGIVKRISKL